MRPTRTNCQLSSFFMGRGRGEGQPLAQLLINPLADFRLCQLGSISAGVDAAPRLNPLPVTYGERESDSRSGDQR